MAKVAKIAKLYLNNELQRVKPGLMFNPGGMEREAVVANNRVVGYNETPVASSLDCVLVQMDDSDVVALGALVDATVRVEWDAGGVYTAKMSVSTPIEMKDGELPLKMTGEFATKE